jgi:ATP-dependent RNA helicase DBP3
MSKRKHDLEAANGGSPPKRSKKEDADSAEEGLTEAQAKKARKEAKKAKKLAKMQAKLEALELKKAGKGEDSETGDVAVDSTVSPPVKDASKDDDKIEPAYRPSKLLKALDDSFSEKYYAEHEIKVTDADQGEIKKTKSTFRPIASFDHLPPAARKYIPDSFTAPTPIQATTWPFLFSGRDVVGIAETGSGKTLAFGLPCIRRIRRWNEDHKDAGQKKGGIRAVIVSPTRELAVQISEQMTELGKKAGVKVAVVYGGVPKDQQRFALETAQVVIATPGRLLDLMTEKYADLSNVDYLCLDEADRMLDKGFEQDIKNIIGATAQDGTRQTVMFTATWPPSVKELASTFMTDYVQITIGNRANGELQANARISQKVEVMDTNDKQGRLVQLLRKQGDTDRVLVFCLYKKEAARVHSSLMSKQFKVSGIHGDLSQTARQSALDSFKAGKTTVLVATDVAARGLDIPAVKLVINLTFPLTIEDYVHRIGRYVLSPLAIYADKKQNRQSRSRWQGHHLLHRL